MKRIGLFRTVLIGAVMALVPLAGVANAQSTDQSATTMLTPAQARAQANLANDLAQCKLAASGAKVPGKPGISGELPPGVSSPACSPGMGTSASMASSSASTSSTSSASNATCAAANRSLTKQELSMVNDYEISLAEAASDRTPVPAMSADVAALIGCL